MNLFKIRASVLTQGANEILGELLALVNVTADLANVSALPLGFGSGLYVIVVIGIGHGFTIRQNTRLGNGADEHSVRIHIDILLDLEGKEGIDISGEEYQAVIRAERGTIGKFIGIASAGKAKNFKYVREIICAF